MCGKNIIFIDQTLHYLLSEKMFVNFQGDSGGPLMTRESDIDAYMLIGVVLGGTKRCARGAPGIYTRVSHYKQWIIDNLH